MQTRAFGCLINLDTGTGHCIRLNGLAVVCVLKPKGWRDLQYIVLTTSLLQQLCIAL